MDRKGFPESYDLRRLVRSWPTSRRGHRGDRPGVLTRALRHRRRRGASGARRPTSSSSRGSTCCRPGAATAPGRPALRVGSLRLLHLRRCRRGRHRAMVPRPVPRPCGETVFQDPESFFQQLRGLRRRDRRMRSRIRSGARSTASTWPRTSSRPGSGPPSSSRRAPTTASAPSASASSNPQLAALGQLAAARCGSFAEGCQLARRTSSPTATRSRPRPRSDSAPLRRCPGWWCSPQGCRRRSPVRWWAPRSTGAPRWWAPRSTGAPRWWAARCPPSPSVRWSWGWRWSGCRGPSSGGGGGRTWVCCRRRPGGRRRGGGRRGGLAHDVARLVIAEVAGLDDERHDSAEDHQREEDEQHGDRLAATRLRSPARPRRTPGAGAAGEEAVGRGWSPATLEEWSG